MTTKYKAYGLDTIEEIEIEKETKSSVWHHGGRELKVSTFVMWFDNFNDAKAHLVDLNMAKVETLTLQLQSARTSLKDICQRQGV